MVRNDRMPRECWASAAVFFPRHTHNRPPSSQRSPPPLDRPKHKYYYIRIERFKVQQPVGVGQATKDVDANKHPRSFTPSAALSNSLTDSLTDSLTHSLTYSLTHSRTCTHTLLVCIHSSTTNQRTNRLLFTGF